MSALVKIAANSPSHSKPSELETNIAQALYDLETSVADLKGALRPLQFHSAKELEVGHGKKAIVIFVPVPLLAAFHNVQQRSETADLPKRSMSAQEKLTRELEKKFSDRHVLFIAQRRILPLPSRRSRVTQKRPRSRTLTAVHDAILSDLVYPTEIVGKRIRTKEDSHKVIKVFLDAKERAGVDYKVDTFGEVYRKLTGKHVVFEFPVVGEY